MKVYVFHSGDTRVALTRDIAGSNLPREAGPWTWFNALDVDAAASENAARLVTALAEKGYVLVPADGAGGGAVRSLKLR